MFSNLSLPWEPCPNHTKHVNQALNIWKWVIDHSHFHKGELHHVSREFVRFLLPKVEALSKDRECLDGLPLRLISTVSLGLWWPLTIYRWFVVQGHGKSSWRSGTRPMFLGIAPGMGSWIWAGTVLDHVFLGFHCLLCVELHRGSPMRFQRIVWKAGGISSGELNPCPCPQFLNFAHLVVDFPDLVVKEVNSCPSLLQFSACW